MQACLSARKDRESSFHHCKGPVNLCKPVYVLECPDKPVLTARRCCESLGSLLKCQERPKKQFTPQWKSCEARASLCMCRKDLIKPF